jgi:hypothetical protein
MHWRGRGGEGRRGEARGGEGGRGWARGRGAAQYSPARREGSCGWKARQVRQSGSSIATSAFCGSSCRRKTDHVHSILGQRGQSFLSSAPYAAATTVPAAFQATAVAASGESEASAPECFSECRQLTVSCCSSHVTSCPSKARDVRLRCNCSSSSGVHCSRKASSSLSFWRPERTIGFAPIAATSSDWISISLVFGCCVRWVAVSTGSVCASVEDVAMLLRQLEAKPTTGRDEASSSEKIAASGMVEVGAEEFGGTKDHRRRWRIIAGLHSGALFIGGGHPTREVLGRRVTRAPLEQQPAVAVADRGDEIQTVAR